MRFGVAFPCIGEYARPGVVAELVDLAEQLGYESAWFGDHVLVPAYARAFTSPEWLDPLASCIVHLARTTRIRCGTDVLVAPYRHPAVVAKLVATADVLTEGRLTLGVGVGYLRGEFPAVGAPPYEQRGEATDEYLAVMNLLWRSGGEPVSFAGRWVSFEDVCFGPDPVQQPFPVWVGGNVPAAHRRAARFGTGWHPLFPTPEKYAAGRRRILGARGTAEGFTFSMSCAITRVLEEGETFAVGTWADDATVPDDFGYAPPVPCAPDGRTRFVGTVDQLRDDIAVYAAAGVEHMALRFAHGDPGTPPGFVAEQLTRFAEVMGPRTGCAGVGNRV
jgi:probable F420-dependent oxidoreductase